MYKIDLLSQSPNNLIFQNDYNKTLFGGLITLIYLIIALSIFLFYGAQFWLNESYQITSFVSEEKVLLDKETERKFFQSEKYNPFLNLTFSLYDNYGYNLSDRFMIYDRKTKKNIPRDTAIDKRANDIQIDILYQCIDKRPNCEIDEKDSSSIYYILVLSYNSFFIDPQSGIPIKRSDYKQMYYFVFNRNIKLSITSKWTIIRYENIKGFFDIFKKKPENDAIKEDDIYIGGKYQNFDKDIINDIYPKYKNDTRYLMGFEISNVNMTNIILYEDYKRRKNTPLDALANVFSLWISLYNGFSFLITKLYSKNFDKYKIIENILLNQKEKHSKNKNQVNKIKEIKIKENLIEKEPVIESNDNLIINDDNYKENEDDNNDDFNFINKEEAKKRILPKRTFCDFICNTFYMEDCCNIKRQKVICACNNIILKYYSIENVLYNQIMIENLLQDYKWNNPELKNILSNDSFDDIKNNFIK